MFGRAFQDVYFLVVFFKETGVIIVGIQFGGDGANSELMLVALVSSLILALYFVTPLYLI